MTHPIRQSAALCRVPPAETSSEGPRRPEKTSQQCPTGPGRHDAAAPRVSAPHGRLHLVAAPAQPTAEPAAPDLPLGDDGARRSTRPARPDIDAATPYEDDDRCWYVTAVHPDGLTLEEVGELLGVTRQRIGQIEERALAKLAAALLTDGVLDVASERTGFTDAQIRGIADRLRWRSNHRGCRTEARYLAQSAAKKRRDPRALLIEFQGECLTSQEWAERDICRKAGVSDGLIRKRLRRGLGVEKALTASPGPRTLTHAGLTLTVAQWAQRPEVAALGISRKRIDSRLGRGWSVADTLTKPARNYGGEA